MMSRSLFDILNVRRIVTENKKEDEHRKVFIETDPMSPFPNDTITALKRAINTGAKDLETDWNSALELVRHAFKELKVPMPMPQQKSRWEQYNMLLADSVQQLYDARGLEGSWRTTNK